MRLLSPLHDPSALVEEVQLSYCILKEGELKVCTDVGSYSKISEQVQKRLQLRGLLRLHLGKHIRILKGIKLSEDQSRYYYKPFLQIVKQVIRTTLVVCGVGSQSKCQYGYIKRRTKETLFNIQLRCYTVWKLDPHSQAISSSRK